MLKMFYPYEYVESVFAIDYGRLYARGYRGIIFDIDNTLVHHGEDSTREVDALFRAVQAAGFRTLLLSNNSEERIRRFLHNIESDFICDADKPDTRNYLRALERLGLERGQVVMVGDQLFTDIWGANKSGIASILVRYLRKDGERRIGKKRQLEKIVLGFYRRNKRYCNRIGGIRKERDL